MPGIESTAASGGPTSAGNGTAPEPGQATTQATVAPVTLGAQQRAERVREAGPVARRLTAAGVAMVALCWVDNTGVARAKTIPLGRLERAAGWGIGMSPVFDVFLINDDITTSKHIGGPGGDLRLVPDLERIAILDGQPGWAWAPVDRYTQDGRVYASCQRSFARRMVEEARDLGLEFRMSFEVEWALGTDDDGRFIPACTGPAYGMTRVIELSDYSREAVEALEREGVVVEQFHPEYAAGQLEISVATSDPVGAADDSMLLRQTIQAVSARHGFQASFAPSVVPGTVGNGGHVHLSLWRDGQNLLAGGPGPHGLSPDAEAFIAGHPRRVARAVRGRRAQCGQLSAPGAVALGRGLPVLGPGEPGSGAPPGDRLVRGTGRQGQHRGQVLRPGGQPLSGGRLADRRRARGAPRRRLAPG